MNKRQLVGSCAKRFQYQVSERLIDFWWTTQFDHKNDDWAVNFVNFSNALAYLELNFKARCQLFKLLNLIWMFKFWYENGAEKIGNVDGGKQAFIIKFIKA